MSLPMSGAACMLTPVGFTLFGRNLDRHYGAPEVFDSPKALTGLWWQQPQNHLSQIVVDDIIGVTAEVITRDVAMKVPGIARGRNLLVGTISDIPLVNLEQGERDSFGRITNKPTAEQPEWLYKSGVVDVWQRMAWTIDDLVFHAASLWYRINGPTRDEHGHYPILDAYRVPRQLWQVTDQGVIQLRATDSAPWFDADADNVIYIPGPGDALLSNGADLIRGARNIDRAWIARTATPIPPTLFEQTEQHVADEDAVDTLLNSWGKARRNPESAGTGFVPYGLTAKFAPVNDDSQMFINGRNAVRLDAANFLNMPASLLDGSTATASLTYQTQEGERSSYYEQTMRYWTAPIEHRLSQDDVVPEGQLVRFDITYATQVPPYGEPRED